MDQIVSILKELTQVVREVHGYNPDNARSREIQQKLEAIEQCLEGLLPERVLPQSVAPISPDRSEREWEALAGRSKPHVVK